MLVLVLPLAKSLVCCLQHECYRGLQLVSKLVCVCVENNALRIDSRNASNALLKHLCLLVDALEISRDKTMLFI